MIKMILLSIIIMGCISNCLSNCGMDWDTFKTCFAKTYGCMAEENYRQNIFKRNVEFITEFNKKYEEGSESFLLSVNHLTDMTREEVVTKMTGFQSSPTRVSSVLNKDVSQYGKGLMFDGNDETCWCSEQGSPQRIQIKLDNPTHISSFQIQFQGGFVGKECEIIITEPDSDEKHIDKFYPEDINSLQTFHLSRECIVKQLVVVFHSSTDFFGRIIIYKFTLLNNK